MKAHILIGAVFLTRVLGAERNPLYDYHPTLEILEQRAGFAANFRNTSNPAQKAKYEAVLEEAAAARHEAVKKWGADLAIKVELITGKKVDLDEKDREKLEAKVRAMDRFLKEHRNNQLLQGAAEAKARRDAEGDEWFAEQQRQRKMNQMQSDLRESEQKLRKLEQGR